jgi:transposase
MPNHKSEDYKLSAVDYYLTEHKSQEEVCKIFKCSARSLMRWVDKYKKDGAIKRHNRTPVAYKIDKNEVKYILEEIKKNKTITMEDLLVKVKEKYHSFDISRRYLGRVIRDNNITLKNLNLSKTSKLYKIIIFVSEPF